MDHFTKFPIQLSFSELTDIVRSTQPPYLGSNILVTVANSLNAAHAEIMETHHSTKSKLDAMIVLNERYEEKLIAIRARLLEFLQRGGDHSPSVIAEINEIIDWAKPR